MKHFYIYCIILLMGLDGAKAQNYYDTSVPNPLVAQNTYLIKRANTVIPPTFENVKSRLPEPFWLSRPDVITCYWKAWQLAFSNLHSVKPENGFISPYIDPAFNHHIFMWDTNFMLLFGQYGRNSFDFQSSLDNFYHAQHSDGYICREISELNGSEIFAKNDPSSTGPNLMPWAEWEYFQNSGDTLRLKAVYMPLLAYYQWFRTNRSWPDGSYFSTGWGCGMDNQPRVSAGYDPRFSPAFMSWVDITAQQVFAGRILIKMAAVLHLNADDIQQENQALITYLNRQMWDEKSSYYYDRFRDGSLSATKSIASYWALIAQAVPKDRATAFIAHLDNASEFRRLHRVPTLSADNAGFSSDGGYWRGGVWAPTTYMVLSGLAKYGQDSLAHVIAVNDLNNIVQVFNQNGILWENYAPDKVQGNDTKNLVGWTGLVPITEMFEYVFGIKADVPANIITWDIRLTDEFGVRKYPFGNNGLVTLHCAKRKSLKDKPKIKINTNVPLFLRVIWDGGCEIERVEPS